MLLHTEPRPFFRLAKCLQRSGNLLVQKLQAVVQRLLLGLQPIPMVAQPIHFEHRVRRRAVQGKRNGRWRRPRGRGAALPGPLLVKVLPQLLGQALNQPQSLVAGRGLRL